MPSSSAPNTITAEEIRGDGETVELTFDDLGANSDDIFVYENPFEDGKGPALATQEDGETFFADCYVIGREVSSVAPETPRSSNLWYIGETEGGVRAAGTAVYFAQFEEFVQNKETEECPK